MRFRFQQLTRHGLWTSPDVFDWGLAEIMASVRSGHVFGQPRAAVEVDTNNVIYSIDAGGLETQESTRLFANAQATPAVARLA